MTVVEHLVPHVPQLLLSVLVSTQALPQIVWDADRHEAAQEPASHVGSAPLIAVEHLLPHAPQFCTFAVRSVHCCPPQTVGDASGQLVAQPNVEPASAAAFGAQNVAVPHPAPQAPQFCAVERSNAQPVPESVQSANPCAHE